MGDELNAPPLSAAQANQLPTLGEPARSRLV